MKIWYLVTLTEAASAQFAYINGIQMTLTVYLLLSAGVSCLIFRYSCLLIPAVCLHVLGRVPAYSVGDNHQEGSGTCNCTEWLVRKKRTAAFLQEDLLNLIEDWKVHHSACSLVWYKLI